MKLRVKADVEELDKVLDFVNQQLEAAKCNEKTKMKIDIVVEELFVNIAHYAYTPNQGQVVVHFERKDDVIIITFIDSGIPYNPLEKSDPDITLSANDREIGGLGIFMVKKMMDKMEYKYSDGKNMLSIYKNIDKI